MRTIHINTERTSLTTGGGPGQKGKRPSMIGEVRGRVKGPKGPPFVGILPPHPTGKEKRGKQEGIQTGGGKKKRSTPRPFFGDEKAYDPIGLS